MLYLSLLVDRYRSTIFTVAYSQILRLMTFELGLCFFTDYLTENHDFKADDPEHNLRRALTQFQLTTSIENQERHIRMVIRELT